ncbi:DUF262 domain-containing protein [Butyrivibrio sp. AE3003]|uniref:DUF262 domain-containing protein n=1 Tax=Butyrivibrio sp. AE3003 TaxID=1496721 RepID=UPI00047BC3A5|nr:DUF262 domain-containing protein [Butyrivibrio sp. AE3003]
MNDQINETNSNKSFWKLINEYEIKIPQLQRDYAQGRQNDAAIEQIRDALIAEFYDALNGGNKLVLNFIYGDVRDDVFTPIDGQQRLTSLFLLHWYIFKRSGFNEGVELLGKFSYLTRDTSRRFCERIKDVELDFTKDNIKEQIEDTFWFSGNFKSDPTIQSMLVVLDVIHSTFINLDDFEFIKNALIGDECPIIFLWLPMEDFNNSDDLYIKMNARGKLLTDFEIFKAKLQNSQYMEMILGEDVSAHDKVVYISNYNNRFAELFYSRFQNKFDDAMMAFVQTYIRDDYYSKASESGVPQKDYRDEYKKIVKMNGSVFFRFIAAGGNGYSQVVKPKQIIAHSLMKINLLLEIFSEHESLDIRKTINKNYYSEEKIFSKNSSDMTFEETVARYALFEYIYKFGYPTLEPEVEAYNNWKRFVYNMVRNTDFGGRPEDSCEAMTVFRNLVDALGSPAKKEILQLIESFDLSKSTAEMKHQLREEKDKAKLIIKSEAWECLIINAEEYFTDGQIGFLMSFSLKGDDFDIAMFEKNFDTAKKLFNPSKNLNESCNSSLFERALLAMKDETKGHTGHLLKQKNSTTTWGFYQRDYGKLLSNRDGGIKRNAMHYLFEKLEDSSNVNSDLNTIIDSVDDTVFVGKDAWKLPFIKNDLFGILLGRFKFRNCIHLNNENQEILLLAGTTVRSYSMELNTLLLSEKLRASGINSGKLQLHMYMTGELYDPKDGFPLRYLSYKGYKVGYYITNRLEPTKLFCLKDSRDNISQYDDNEIFDKILKM